MQQQRELTMTVVCKSCSHQYGAWRDRCPACGTRTPPPPVKVQAEREKRKRQHERRESKTQCIACRQRGAKKMRCPFCDERIHHTCLSLHVEECKQFQRDREAALARLTSKENDRG